MISKNQAYVAIGLVLASATIFFTVNNAPMHLVVITLFAGGCSIIVSQKKE